MCKDRVSLNCGGQKTFAACVFTEIDFPSWSTLYQSNCAVQEEVNEELYGKVDTILQEINLSSLSSTCFKIDTDSHNKITAQSFATTVVKKLEELICPDEENLRYDINISSWNLDFKCLSAECDAPITKLSKLTQLVINQLCAIGTGGGDCCSLESSRLVGDSTTQDIYVHNLTVGTGTGSISTNTAFGTDAIKNNSAGTNLVGIGYKALNANTTATGNTAVGAYALKTVNTGNENVAVGTYSLEFLTSGDKNIAVGHQSLNQLTTGGDNTALGYAALRQTTIGEQNTAVGSGTLNLVTSGNNNTALGYTTGLGITTGSGNTIIGANVISLSANLTNNIIIAIGTGAIKAQYKGDATEPTWYLSLPTYNNNAAAALAGIAVDGLYKTSTGEIRIRV